MDRGCGFSWSCRVWESGFRGCKARARRHRREMFHVVNSLMVGMQLFLEVGFMVGVTVSRGFACVVQCPVQLARSCAAPASLPALAEAPGLMPLAAMTKKVLSPCPAFARSLLPNGETDNNSLHGS